MISEPIYLDPLELFQILKDDAVKVLHSICKQIWKTQQWPQDWKRSVFIPIQKKGNAKECSNYHTIALISHASKVMLKILQARLQRYVNHDTKIKPVYVFLQETHFRPKDTYRLKVSGWKNIFHANEKQRKAGVSILISQNTP